MVHRLRLMFTGSCQPSDSPPRDRKASGRLGDLAEALDAASATGAVQDIFVDMCNRLLAVTLSGGQQNAKRDRESGRYTTS
jgi:hypothetical protein